MLLRYADIAEKFVLKWDIRMVGKLREIIPELFPRSLKTGILVAEMDDNCDWVVNARN